MAKKFYQVIRNGEIIATRTSERDYTHAYVLIMKHRWIRQGGESVKTEVPEFTGRVCFSGSLALAQKSAPSEAKLCGATRFEIIPVTVTEKKGRKNAVSGGEAA